MVRRSRSGGDLVRELSAELQRGADPFTFARLADLLREQGRLVEARSTCEQCIARFPQYTTVRLALARVCESEGDLDRAEAELREVITAEPHNRVARVTLGRLLLQRGALGEARQHLEFSLFLAPNDPSARALLARSAGQEITSGETGPRPVEPIGSSAAVDRALAHLSGTDGVEAAVLVDPSGLLIGSVGGAGAPEDVVSALAHETWQLARRCVVRMHLGTLRQATLIGAARAFVLAPSRPGLLAVAASSEAKLGLVNLQVEAAQNMLAGV